MQQAAAIPRYLQDTYWWAYVHPNAVRLFERQWLVNLILWGNFAKLRDAALDALGVELPGCTLQIACVYGDFTQRLLPRIEGRGSLDVVDVLSIQLKNLRRKLPAGSSTGLMLRDASDLGFSDGSYDRAILFFLLHEMPLDVRCRTLEEAFRVVKPGGTIVIVDYHPPVRSHPLRGVMRWILRNFEPFALDLWQHEIATWFPQTSQPVTFEKQVYWGGLYQRLCITVPDQKPMRNKA